MATSAPLSTGLLALCATALGAVVVLELTGGLPIAPQVTVAAPGVAEVTVPEPAEYRAPPPAAFDVISERPLFVASRRPFEPEVDLEPAADPVQEAPLEPLAADLVGVMLTERGRSALIHREGESRPQRLHPGQTLDGWRFESLERDRAVFRQGEDVQVLPLRAD